MIWRYGDKSIYRCISTTYYGTAHIQVYKQTVVMHRALRNFEDNSCVGLVPHKEYTACVRLLIELKILVSNSCRAVLYSQLITLEW